MESNNCVGKECGQGKVLSGGKFVCPHNNLAVKYPELIEEWHESNENSIYDYLPNSGKKVWWVCKLNPCGCHAWESSICNRTGKKSGCPFCSGYFACKHNNLEVSYPELKEEWHPDNLSPMSSYTSHTHFRALWKCKLNPCGCHVWESKISDRTRERSKGSSSGCPYCSNKKLCAHNNLGAIHPNLITEWHPDNSKSINEYAPYSNVKTKWTCSKSICECHIWDAVISSRASGRGCPYCANLKLCDHNNLEAMFPQLKIEWHPDNPKPMKEYPPGSDSKVKWICSKNNCGCHIWTIDICSRTGPNKNGCPYCASNRVCIHNNLETKCSELKLEWHPDNNPMNSYPEFSPEIVKWICSKNPCGCHIWNCSISNRTGLGKTGCPYCVNLKLCDHNNLESKYPELKLEWHPDNKSMNKYASGSNEKVNWICQKNPCGCHIWSSSVSNRTGSRKNGCPYCSNKKLCDHNNLEAKRPELKIEWHSDNLKQMKEYSPRSSENVKWICKNNSQHTWSTIISNRTRKVGGNCPHCSKSKGYSDMQIIWIKDIEISQNLTIQHALCVNGEFKISGIGKVDGYCKENNTVYEFHGDYWHGNPLIYNEEDINLTIGNTFGYLYEKTIKRDENIRQLGYNLVIKWETEEKDIEELD